MEKLLIILNKLLPFYPFAILSKLSNIDKVRYQTICTKGMTIMTGHDELIKELFSFSSELHQKTVQAHQAHSTFIGRGKILCLLAKHDYIYQNQLAKFAKIKPGSLTQILEKMETDHLIIRKRDQRDRRLIYVKLSHEGKKQLARNEQYHREFQEFMTAPLSEAEIEQFISTLKILRGRFNEYIKQKEMGKK